MSVQRALILQTSLPPGDVCTLTAAIESLHAQYPRRFLTDVRTDYPAIFQHNPHVSPVADGSGELIEMHYGDISESDRRPHAFVRGYTHHLGRYLGIPLEVSTNRPHMYLADDEQSELPRCTKPFFPSGQGRFWLISAGVKRDFTLKQWPLEHYQAIVSHFAGRITFVQVGAVGDDHHPLSGCVNLIGKTSHRDLIRLAFFCQGGLGPITYLQHLCAAFEKPYVALLGGREPVSWTQYPLQTTLHTLGKLPCCRRKACWRSRVVPLNDGQPQDRHLCELPVLDFSRPVGKCMAIIKPIDVIRAIETCYDGGSLTY